MSVSLGLFYQVGKLLQRKIFQEMEWLSGFWELSGDRGLRDAPQH